MRNRPSGPILKYYLYTATTYASFTNAIWILFVRAQDLSWAQVGALNSVWWLALVASEIPTGYVGDRVGRRTGMLVGTLLVTAMTVAMGLSTTFLQLLVVYALWAVGQTFRTGSDDAWLYDLLAETDATSTFAAVRGRAAGLGLAVGALTAPVGGALADTNVRLPFFATAFVTVIGVPILLSVPESGDRDGDPLTVGVAARVIRERLVRPPLRSFVLYFALLYGVLQMTYIFDQPVTQAVALRFGVPPSLSMTAVGIVYAGFTLVSAVVSYKTGWIRSRVGTRRWFAVVPFVAGALYAVLWISPILAVPVFFVTRSINVASVSIGNQYVNDRVASVGRATVLSAASMVYSLAVVPFELAGGVVADALSPTGALASFGVVLVVGAVVLRLWESPVHGGPSGASDGRAATAADGEGEA